MDLDAKLIELLLYNSEKGLSKLIDNYSGLVYTIVYSKLSDIGSKEDIEECVSDIFYEIYKNIREVDLHKGSIKAYLSVIAKRRAIDTYRKLLKHTSNTAYIDEIDYEYIQDDKDCVENEVFEKETKDELINGIKNSGEPDSQIIIRKYFLGQSTRRIASELKMKVNTVDKRVSRGLSKLKLLLGGVL